MSTNFNLKINAIKDFRLSGMIWYQGETDLIFGNTCYAEQFSLLQESYTEYFSFENGLLPVIYTQIAAYNYSDDGFCLNDWNIMYCEMQNEKPSSRAVVTISDVPLTYLPEAGLIHPESKEEIVLIVDANHQINELVVYMSDYLFEAEVHCYNQFLYQIF